MSQVGDVVAFSLLNGADIIGKIADENLNADFVAGENVIYLKDAVVVMVQADEQGENHQVVFGPVTMFAEREHPQKAFLPYALNRGAIVGQYSLSLGIGKLYREYTSGIILAR